MQSLVNNSRNMKQEENANLKRKIDGDEELGDSTTPPPQKMQRQDIVNLWKQDETSPVAGKNVHSNYTKTSNVENYTDKPNSAEAQKNKYEKYGKECNQCAKSSAHIATIIKQIINLEKKLTIDMNQKEEQFQMEKDAWKVRERELKEALAQKDDGSSKEFANIKQVLEKNKEDLDFTILERDEQANKIVKMQELNGDLSDKYDKVKKELEHLKKLKNINKGLKEKVKQNEDIIAVQAKSISTLEFEISQNCELISSLKTDLETKGKEIEYMQEKNEETKKMLNEKNDEIKKEVQRKDQIICDLKLKKFESENTMNNIQNTIIKKEDSISKILEEKKEWENKYIKSQEVSNNLKQDNEQQKAQNQYLVKWKETEIDKLRSTLKLRLSNMVEKNGAKEKLYQQKIQSLENLLNQKAGQ